MKTLLVILLGLALSACSTKGIHVRTVTLHDGSTLQAVDTRTPGAGTQVVTSTLFHCEDHVETVTSYEGGAPDVRDVRTPYCGPIHHAHGVGPSVTTELIGLGKSAVVGGAIVGGAHLLRPDRTSINQQGGSVNQSSRGGDVSTSANNDGIRANAFGGNANAEGGNASATGGYSSSHVNVNNESNSSSQAHSQSSPMQTQNNGMMAPMGHQD
jgi:hypothetical protein